MTHSDNPRHYFPDRPVVLIVDDEVMIRDIARITLEREGFCVLTAGNGEEALVLSRQYPGVIHVLLTDFDMPKMNGVELSTHVCNDRPDTRILMMSGRYEKCDSRSHFLRKPFGPRELAETVTGLIAVRHD